MSSTSPLKIIFAGTPDFAAGHLQALLGVDAIQVIAVYSQPDRPAGRGKTLQPSPVKALALAHDIPVYQPLNFKTPESLAELQALQADVMVVVAYGLLLPQAVLDAPKYGCINVHASLLPRWRGAAPIERAIAAEDAESGVTIMQMDAGLDTGAMLAISRMALDAQTTGDSLRADLLALGCPALIATLADVQSQRLQPVAQNEADTCYAAKLSKAEALIDWTQSAAVIAAKIRAFNSSNVCMTDIVLADGSVQRLKLWQASSLLDTSSAAAGSIIAVTKAAISVACGTGQLQLQELQLANGKRMSVAAILNGRPDFFRVGGSFQGVALV